MNASDIMELLADRHYKDLFVGECKSGPTMCSKGLLKMDAWVLKRSWASPCMLGYEIKVTRADFVRDDKWRGYLPLCNQFYFVCPSGLIAVDELSAEVGLLVTTKTGTRLLTKKKVPHREIEPPIDLLLYVLISRTRICASYSAQMLTNREYWEQWLGDKDEKLELGTRCSQKLRKSYEEQVYDVQSKMRKLESKMEDYDGLLKICKELDVDPNNWHSDVDFRNKAEAALSMLPKDFLVNLTTLQQQISNAIIQVETLNKAVK